MGTTLTAGDVADLAAGCALLGSGGGGDPHAFRLVLEGLLAERGPVRVVDPDDLPADALAVNVGFLGAPVVMTEKLFCEEPVVLAVEGMRRRLGRPVDAVMAAEIGGANGLSAAIAGSLLGLPVVDADGMGRAFPMSDQVSYSIHGRSASPTVASTEHGDVVCVESPDNRRVEDLVRAVSTANGAQCFTADYPLSGDDVRECAVLGSVSLARRLGAALADCRRGRRDPLDALAAAFAPQGPTAVRALFAGKVVDRRHATEGGFDRGTVTLASVPAGRTMTLDFQNEFLVARADGQVVATTPDIISVVDAETFSAIGSEGIRYGQRVRVVGIEAPARMRTPRALEVVGPGAFGLDLDYVPVRDGGS